MSKFHFQLATLLRLREATRDERRVELAEVHRSDAELGSQLTRLNAEQGRLREDRRREAGPGLVNLPRLIAAQQYARALRAREAEVTRTRQTLAAEIDRCRQALLEADRDVRMLEKLRQHQSETHGQEAERQESKRLDEAALRTTGNCEEERKTDGG
jgi:flagellar protein FliJ